MTAMMMMMVTEIGDKQNIQTDDRSLACGSLNMICIPFILCDDQMPVGKIGLVCLCKCVCIQKGLFF